MKRHISLTLFLLVSAVSASAAAPPVPPPSISISDLRVVVVTGVSPGEDVALFGASQQVGNSVRLRRWQRLLTDSDSDGIVVWNLEEEITTDTLWVAVDLSSGGTAVATPPESRFRGVPFPADALRKGGNDQLEHFVAGRGMIDVLIVRPKVGAWAGFAVDGHPSDADQQQNGRSTIAFRDARALDARAPAPRHLTPRDVVIAVDLRKLEYYTTEVSQ
jgi:hypothetical protein